MSAIRGKHTSPELLVRKAVRQLGYRYRLHSRKLPGIPDIVLPDLKTAVFVNGCFWHQHKNCKRCSVPKTNRRYWVGKLKRNVEHFVEVRKELRQLGWKVVVVWECQTKKNESLLRALGTKIGA
jgi:DNA mismatch endonuclease (patch repair protein)